MESITVNDYSIFFNLECYNGINKHFKENIYSKIFILVDENTHNHCLPIFLSRFETSLEIEIIEIESGEKNKTIETCISVWNVLSELGADRKSILINLGGGVITDIGGFIASTFKRGIAYINIPTTLLAMVDASVGGKTGIDLGHLKNQIGVINSGKMVLIDIDFLDTLPKNQFRSGLAEMLKHGLIHSEDYWNEFDNTFSLESKNLDNLIRESVIIKKGIVEKDPNEIGVRKTLNYGHTLGHAIETYYLSNKEKIDLLHGEAVAIGMVLATYLSVKIAGFDELTCNTIKEKIISIYGKTQIDESDYKPIIDLLKFDKKNEHGKINFVLLKDFGKSKINCQVTNDLIIESFDFYLA